MSKKKSREKNVEKVQDPPGGNVEGHVEELPLVPAHLAVAVPHELGEDVPGHEASEKVLVGHFFFLSFLFKETH